MTSSLRVSISGKPKSMRRESSMHITNLAICYHLCWPVKHRDQTYDAETILIYGRPTMPGSEWFQYSTLVVEIFFFFIPLRVNQFTDILARYRRGTRPADGRSRDRRSFHSDRVLGHLRSDCPGFPPRALHPLKMERILVLIEYAVSCQTGGIPRLEWRNLRQLVEAVAITTFLV